MARLKIGALAELTGTNAPTIRYYEEIGLLRSADRQSGGQRIYGDDDVKRLTFIRRCREFGFSIDQVRSLLAKVSINYILRCCRCRRRYTGEASARNASPCGAAALSEG